MQQVSDRKILIFCVEISIIDKDNQVLKKSMASTHAI